jgi:Na+/H+ antiporter NhaD/arsenite permease-like protein
MNVADNIYIRYWNEGIQKQTTKNDFYVNSLIANIICILSVIMILYYFFRVHIKNKSINKKQKNKIY